jgi:hypothetical protein
MLQRRPRASALTVKDQRTPAALTYSIQCRAKATTRGVQGRSEIPILTHEDQRISVAPTPGVQMRAKASTRGVQRKSEPPAHALSLPMPDTALLAIEDTSIGPSTACRQR